MPTADSRDLEAGTRASADNADPLQELAGWHAEPMLLRRLNLYIVEGILECAALAAAMLSARWLEGARAPPLSKAATHPEFFERLLVLPLSIAALRLTWSLSLFFGYHTFSGAGTPQIIQRRGRLQRRSFWTCSAAMLTCFSCLLMMWHVIMFLLLTGYSPAPAEERVVWGIFGINIMCTIVHWLFWRDFVKNYRDTEDAGDPERFLRLEQIYRMYKAREIQIRRYKDVAPVATPRGTPASCMVCIEDFKLTDDVAVLPCGHYFHPACANKWLCEKWACPLRCAVDQEALAREKAVAGAQQAPPQQPASAAVRISAAARQAAVQQAASRQGGHSAGAGGGHPWRGAATPAAPPGPSSPPPRALRGAPRAAAAVAGAAEAPSPRPSAVGVASSPMQASPRTSPVGVASSPVQASPRPHPVGVVSLPVQPALLSTSTDDEPPPSPPPESAQPAGSLRGGAPAATESPSSRASRSSELRPLEELEDRGVAGELPLTPITSVLVTPASARMES